MYPSFNATLQKPYVASCQNIISLKIKTCKKFISYRDDSKIMKLKFSWYWGCIGFLGFLGFIDPLYYVFFVFLVFFLEPLIKKTKRQKAQEPKK